MSASNSLPVPRIRKFTAWTNQARTVLGWLSVELPSGLIINDCKLMVGPNGKLWLAMPSVPQTDQDGRPRIGPNGKPLWATFVDFRDKATRERFQAPILEALRQAHPELFGGKGAS